jgi:hypothetical protein
VQKRTLGRTGLEVSSIGPGCIGMCFGYCPAKEPRGLIPVLSDPAPPDIALREHRRGRQIGVLAKRGNSDRQT